MSSVSSQIVDTFTRPNTKPDLCPPRTSGPPTEPISIQVDAALGPPRYPMTTAQLDEKVERLTDGVLTGALADPDRPASEILHLLEQA